MHSPKNRAGRTNYPLFATWEGWTHANSRSSCHTGNELSDQSEPTHFHQLCIACRRKKRIQMFSGYLQISLQPFQQMWLTTKTYSSTRDKRTATIFYFLWQHTDLFSQNKEKNKECSVKNKWSYIFLEQCLMHLKTAN